MGMLGFAQGVSGGVPVGQSVDYLQAMSPQLGGRNFNNSLSRGVTFFLGDLQIALRTNVRNSSYIQPSGGVARVCPMTNFSPGNAPFAP